MTEIQKEKAKFVKDFLEPLVQNAAPWVVSLKFDTQGEYYEFVQIFYENGYIKTVNVSMDNTLALSRDVLKCIR